MPDINKFIRNPDAIKVDPNGYLLDLEPWSPERAVAEAAAEGLELDADHFDMLTYLRQDFACHGPDGNARQLSDDLDRVYTDRGGLRFLYRLFPGGPVAQGRRLAGLPAANGALDASFGTTH